MQRTYLAIDLKSYYASAECAARHLDPLTTNLVVADSSRTEKTICLAVSPSLKAYGIPGRARLFEVVQKVNEVNANRLREAVRLRKAVYKNGKPSFSSASYDSLSLAADPSLELSYLVAPPRMAYYEKVSRQIYGIYLKYIAPEDIVVYSIDEVFIDATSYLSHYNMTAHKMKAHKYWSLGALACMAGCFYTGCKKLMQAHKYFACGSLVCMGMAIYSGHKIAPKKLKSLKNKNTRPRRNKRGLFFEL